MAQQIAESAIAFEEQRLGRKPSSVTVVQVFLLAGRLPADIWDGT